MTEKADHALRLLNDPVLKEAFEEVRNTIHKGWEKCRPTDTEAQHEWHRRLHTLASVEHALRQYVQDGKIKDFRANQKPAPLGDLLSWRKLRGL